MKTFEISLQGDMFKVSYHPHISNFIIIANSSGKYMMMLENEGRWRCLNTISRAAEGLPVNQLYEYTEFARKNRLSQRAAAPRRNLL